MGLASRARNWYADLRGSGYRAAEVSREDREALREAIGEGKLLRVAPYPENQGMKGSEEFLQNIHDPIKAWFGLKNRSRVESFEIWFEDGEVSFQYYLPDREDRQREQNYRSLIDAEYTKSRVSGVNGLFPAVGEGEYIAGAEFDLKRMRHFPIRSVDGIAEFVFDPYRALISSITGDLQNRVVLQFVYKSALDSWSEGGPTGKLNPRKPSVADISERVREGRYEEGIVEDELHEPSREERGIAEVIADQRDKPAYHVNVRLLTISPNKSDAEQKARTIATTIKNEYSEVRGQKLVPSEMRGEETLALADRMVRRDFVDRNITLTIPELSGLAHIPNQSIEIDAVQWDQSEQFGQVPPQAQRFSGGASQPADRGIRLGAAEEDEVLGQTESEPEPGPEENDESAPVPDETDAVEMTDAHPDGEPVRADASGTGEPAAEPAGAGEPSVSPPGDNPPVETEDRPTEVADERNLADSRAEPEVKNGETDSPPAGNPPPSEAQPPETGTRQAVETGGSEPGMGGQYVAESESSSSGLFGSMRSFFGLGPTGAGVQPAALERGYGSKEELEAYRRQKERSGDRQANATGGNDAGRTQGREATPGDPPVETDHPAEGGERRGRADGVEAHEAGGADGAGEVGEATPADRAVDTERTTSATDTGTGTGTHTGTATTEDEVDAAGGGAGQDAGEESRSVDSSPLTREGDLKIDGNEVSGTATDEGEAGPPTSPPDEAQRFDDGRAPDATGTEAGTSGEDDGTAEESDDGDDGNDGPLNGDVEIDRNPPPPGKLDELDG